MIFNNKIFKVKKTKLRMAFCIKCGATIDEIENHCTVCGHKNLIEAEKNHETYLKQTLPKKYRNSVTEKSNGDFFNSNNTFYNFISIIILCISILLVSAFCIWLWDRSYGERGYFLENKIFVSVIIVYSVQVVSYFASKSIYIIHKGSVDFNRYDFIPFFIGYLFYAQVDDSLKLHKFIFLWCIGTLVILLLLTFLRELLKEFLVCFMFACF